MIIKDTYPKLLETLTLAVDSEEEAVQIIQDVADCPEVPALKDGWHLSGACIWSSTPQGHAFWHKLNKQMSKYYKMMDLLEGRSDD